MKNNTSAVKYLKESRRRLMFAGKNKNRLFNEISNDINAFCAENPTCEYDDIVNVFGAPEEIANEIVCGEDVALAFKKHKAISNVFGGILGLIIIALIATVVCITINDSMFFVKTIIYR